MPEIYSISQEGNITCHTDVLNAEVEDTIKELSSLSHYQDRLFIIGNHIRFRKVVDNIRGEKTVVISQSLQGEDRYLNGLSATPNEPTPK